MNDRELLEYAAKAARVNAEWEKCASHMDDYELLGECGPFVNNSGWNPLTDDGDAFRLAVKLRIGFTIDEENNKVHGWTSDISGTIQFSGTNEKSVRYAIVKTAAEIWKRKE